MVGATSADDLTESMSLRASSSSAGCGADAADSHDFTGSLSSFDGSVGAFGDFGLPSFAADDTSSLLGDMSAVDVDSSLGMLHLGDEFQPFSAPV